MNREEAALKQTVKFTRKDAREFLMQTSGEFEEKFAAEAVNRHMPKLRHSFRMPELRCGKKRIPRRAPIEIFDKFKPFFIKPLPFGFVFIFGTMVFACRESFLSFKSFPCRPLTSILCHIPCPCRSLRRRHLFFSEAEPGSFGFIYSVGFFCKFPAASSLQTPTISPISQSSTSHMRTSTSSETYLSRRRFVIVFGASFVARRRSALLIFLSTSSFQSLL